MGRVARIVTAVFAALALMALPIVPDYCADSCEAHQAAAARAPTCHHAAPVAAHVGRVPVRCGHEHRVTVATAAVIPMSVSSAPIAVVACVRMPLVSLSFDRRLAGHSPPDSASTVQHQPLPLRV